MNYELSIHAEEAVRERGIERRWIEQVLNAPAHRAPDRRNPTLQHLLAAIDEFGGRTLRVVINPSAIPIRVVTVYFDRKMKGKV